MDYAVGKPKLSSTDGSPRLAGAATAFPRGRRYDIVRLAAGAIITMIDTVAHQQPPESLLAELARARAQMVDIHLRAIKQVMAARSALGIASVARCEPGTVCFVGEGGTQLTVADLADLVKELATNEGRLRHLIAQVDEQATRILKSMPGEPH